MEECVGGWEEGRRIQCKGWEVGVRVRGKWLGGTTSR